MNQLRKIILLCVLVLSEFYFGQRHLNGENYGPVDASLGLKCLVTGGVVWGIGMLLGTFLRKTEDGTVADGQTLYSIVGILCIGGGAIAVLGLIFMGFG